MASFDPTGEFRKESAATAHKLAAALISNEEGNA